MNSHPEAAPGLEAEPTQQFAAPNLLQPHRTFRDPAGHVEVHADHVLRHVHPAYSAAMLEFLHLPIARQLVAQGDLIGSEILPLPAEAPGTFGALSMPLLLQHPRVSFVSYPWEWPPALWLAAADLTLDLCDKLLREGWTLKDATPLNVLFQGVRPVFVDVLSIERADLTHTLWLPYGQFVRTFLLPMLAHLRLGWPLHATLMRRDGYEPEEIYAALSLRERMRRPALSAVTLPTMMKRRAASDSEDAAPPRPTSKDPELTRHVLRKTFQGLRRQMRRTVPPARTSTWSDYAATATHYSEPDHDAKRSFVSEVLAQCRPQRLLDIGCNTGVYSRLAARAEPPSSPSTPTSRP